MVFEFTKKNLTFADVVTFALQQKLTSGELIVAGFHPLECQHGCKKDLPNLISLFSHLRVLLQQQISFALMVSHARVNDGLSQTPAPSRRPSLEEKSHPWSLPRHHRNHILFDNVPLLWSLSKKVNVSLRTILRKVWREFFWTGKHELHIK